jgi:SPP1 gp7 family putative phage head morphogenesis protein
MAGEGTKTPIDSDTLKRVAVGANYSFGKPGQGWFGPLLPLTPMVPEAMQPSVRGRQLDFAAGFNLRNKPRADEPVTFAQMRSLADACDVLRLVIETRKDQMAMQTFSVVPVDEHGKSDARCKEVEAFFRLPDGENDYAAWQRMILEDMFVLDAVAVYPWRANDGSLHRLDIMDASTIKRVINEQGRTPQPPDPAYQQVLKGVPASNYTSEELLYAMRNRRSNKVYGFSPVEQIIMTVNTAIRRSLHQMQFYTEGSTPDLLMSCPQDWNMDQVRDFNDWWMSMLAGNTAGRRKGLFIPHGVAPINTKDGALKDGFDEWLARIVCYAFSVSPTPFVASVNRATAESAQDAAIMEGLQPVMLWMKGILDIMVWRFFGYTDLHVKWNEGKTIDPAEQNAINDAKLRSGRKTMNECRADDGADPVEGGDRPVFFTANGPVDYALLLEANNKAATAPPPEPVAPGEADDPGDPPPRPVEKPNPGEKPPAVDAAAAAAAVAKSESTVAAAQDAIRKASKKGASPIDRNRPAIGALRRVLTRKVTKHLTAIKAAIIAAAVQAYGATPRPVVMGKAYDENQERDEGGKWTKVGGQLGSNSGGVYTSPAGTKHYVKHPDNADQVHAEVAADQLYELMGVQAMGHTHETVNGKASSASEWKDVTPLGGKGWQNLTDKQVQQAANAYVASALTKNWDVVGLVFDNMGMDKAGNLAIMDTGGSFMFRAQGGPKPFGGDATPDLKAMLDKSFASGKAFAPLMASHRGAFVKAADKLAKLPEAKLLAAVAGLTASHKNVGKELLARRDSIVAFMNEPVGKQHGGPHADAWLLDQVYRAEVMEKAGADKELIDAILAGLDLAPFESMTPEVAAVLSQVLADAGHVALTQVGMATTDMLALVNEGAVQHAAERAAELVARISESTREMLRSDIADAMKEGWSNDRLASELEDSYGFSAERAEVIARTETAYADVQGNLAAYEASGVVSEKQWITGEGCCDLCDALDGVTIGMNEQFEADGEFIDGPPFHPNCRCDLLPVLSFDEGAAEEAATEKLERALAAFEAILKAYNPDQPRGPGGMWSSEGGADGKPVQGMWHGQGGVQDKGKWMHALGDEAVAHLKLVKKADTFTDDEMNEAAEQNSLSELLSDFEYGAADIHAKLGMTPQELLNTTVAAFANHQGATYSVKASEIPALDLAFQKSAVVMASPVVVFRGMTLPTDVHDAILSGLKAGSSVMLPHFEDRFVCTSSRRSVGENFSSSGSGSMKTLLHIVMPKNSEAMFPNGFTKAFDQEKELTIARGAKINIVSGKSVKLYDGTRRTEFIGVYVGSAHGDNKLPTPKAPKARKSVAPGDISKVHGDAHKSLVVASHGVVPGDPAAEFAGDRPGAYDRTMTDALFERHFTGDLDSVASITFSDGTQCHGKLVAGHKPAKGYRVNKDGFVVAE